MLIYDQSPMKRKARRPQHQFALEQTPWVIQPFLLAPVLPGESLTNILLQARVVSDPVAHRLTGWWLEYFLFYVKLTDLDDADSLKTMFVDPSASISSLYSSTSAPYYHVGGAPNYTQMCLKRVTEEYFRDEGEAWNTWTIPVNGVSMPVAKAQMHDSWCNSLMGATDYAAEDFSVDIDGNATITPREIMDAVGLWAQQRAAGITTLDYESYLKSMGIPVEEVLERRPELIRYVREWTYPTNTVNPSTGAPTSALSWSIQERADKKRYFKHPGFIFGVTVVRPKVYRGNQQGQLAHYLRTAQNWLPALARANPEVSMEKFDGAGTGAESLIGGSAEDYVFDWKDLFLYGDQFLNKAPAPTTAPEVQLPQSDMSHVYPVEADVDPLFITGETGCFVDQDGVVALTIQSLIGDDTSHGTPEV